MMVSEEDCKELERKTSIAVINLLDFSRAMYQLLIPSLGKLIQLVFTMIDDRNPVYLGEIFIYDSPVPEYSCAVKPHVQNGGNRYVRVYSSNVLSIP